MSTRTDLLTTTRDVDLKWTATVDYEAPPRFADAMPVYDDFVYAVDYERPADEFIFTSDAVSLSSGFTRAPVDAVTLVESFSRVGTFGRVFVDGMVATDSVTLLLGTIGNVNYADTVAMTEAFSRALTMLRSLADSMVTSDAFASTSTVVTAFADSVALTDGQQFDPYWPFVQMLLHGDGPQSGGNATFLDSATYARPMTAVGAAYQGSVSPFTDAGGSVTCGLFGEDYATSPVFSGYAFPAGTDFTVECWFMLLATLAPDGSGNRHGTLVSSRGVSGDGWDLGVQGDATNTGIGLFFEKTTGGVYDSFGGAATVSKNVWHHAAVCRQGTLTRMFLDGVQIASYTLADQNLPADGLLGIGSNTFGSGNSFNRLFGGYISEVRVAKGGAYYTGAFTPAITPFTAPGGDIAILAHFTNAAIFDSARKSNILLNGAYPSTSFPKWGPTSIVFSPGGGVFAAAAAGEQRFAPMGQDFTVECWFNLTADALPDGAGNKIAALLSSWPGGGAITGWSFVIKGDAASTNVGLEAWFSTNNVHEIFTAPSAISKNVWHHAALSRSAGVIYIHLDGVLIGTFHLTNPTIQAPNLFTIGHTPYPSYNRDFTGFIDDVRLTMGIGRYGNANFTRPGAPFPNGVAKYSRSVGLLSPDTVTMTDGPTVVNAPGVTFVLKNTYPTASAPVVSWAGAQAGDLAVVFLVSSASNPPGTMPTGWTPVGLYQWTANVTSDIIVQKLLTAADITAGSASFTGMAVDGLAGIYVVRGPTSAIPMTVGDTTTATTSAAGFTKPAGTKSILTYGCTRQTTATLASPAGTVSRVANYTVGGANFKFSYDDILSGTSYTDGTALTYTGGATETVVRSIVLSNLPIATTTWDPANTSGDIQLDQYNRRCWGNTNDASCRAKNGKSSGKWYFEITNLIATTNAGYIGFLLATANLNTAMVNGGCNGLTTGGVLQDSFGSVVSSTWPAWNTGNSVICMAIDLGTRKMWARKPGGTWNAAGSGADPATGVGGADLSASGGPSTAGSTVFIAASPEWGNVVLRINTGQEAFAGVIPAGFTPWG